MTLTLQKTGGNEFMTFTHQKAAASKNTWTQSAAAQANQGVGQVPKPTPASL